MTKKSLRTLNDKKKYNRKVNMCGYCGRIRFHIRFFGLCRICLRRFASEGKIPGLGKR